MKKTTADKVSKSKLQDVLDSIKALRDYLDDVEKAVKSKMEAGGGVVNIAWGYEMMRKALNVFSNISGNNGASLVRLEDVSDDDKS